jgi:signal recognition particle subunit SRP54
MIGQDAVRTAAEFDRRLSFTGFVLTKLDGDARGGAALSIKEVTHKPIKFLGMGEALDKLDDFRPEGLADRILGFGDVVGLVKDFEKVIDKEQAEKDAQRMLKGEFSFGDFLQQIAMLKKMGSLRSLMERLPGMGDLLEQIPAEALDDRELVKVEAMIQSMTNQERSHPDLLNESRMRRISRGSGRDMQEVKDLYSRFKVVRGMMGGLGAMMGGGGGMPAMAGGGGFPGFPGMGGGRAQRRLSGMASDGPALSADEKIRRAKEKKEQRKARKANRRKR